MTDFELDSKEASIVKDALKRIDPIVEMSALRLNNDFCSAKLQSGIKGGVAKIRCNLIGDIKDDPQHGGHLDTELRNILCNAINSMN